MKNLFKNLITIISFKFIKYFIMDISRISEIYLLIKSIINPVYDKLKKGHVEKTYQEAILIELQDRHIPYNQEVVLPILYKGREIAFMRADIICYYDIPFIMELKATSTYIKDDEKWQLLRYLDEKKINIGVVVNFSQSSKLTDGLQICLIVKIDDIFNEVLLDPSGEILGFNPIILSVKLI